MLDFQRRAVQRGQQAVERFNLVDDQVADASTRRAIEAMEPSRGRTFDANSEKLAQAAALAGYAAGMDRLCVFRCS